MHVLVHTLSSAKKKTNWTYMEPSCDTEINAQPKVGGADQTCMANSWASWANKIGRSRHQCKNAKLLNDKIVNFVIEVGSLLCCR
jgi:hypothetical protein